MEEITSQDENPKQKGNVGRREFLKTLVAGSGAVAAAAFLPAKWTRPVVKAGVLPAHAQGTMEPQPPSGNLAVELYWAVSYTPYDIDLHVIDPADGNDVFIGATATMTGVVDDEASPGDPATENSANSTPDVIATGTYQIYISTPSGGDFQTIVTANVTVTVNGNPTVIDMKPYLDTYKPQSLRVADVTFPPGTLVNRAGQPYP